jgi:hypothetical protein
LSAENPESRRTRHPEIFWVLFTVVSGTVLLAVVTPAQREHAAAAERIRQVRSWAAEHQAYLEDLRATRQGLENGDRDIWEAVARNQGMSGPEELRLPPSPKAPR